MTLVFHIVAGLMGIATGFVALYAAKGARLHRKSGMLFVYTMLATCVFGLTISVVRGVAPSVNVPAALLTSYMIISSLNTVRPLANDTRWMEIGLMVLALAVGLTSLTFAFEAIGSPDGKGRDGMPSFPFFLFGIVGTLAGVSDIRVIRSGPLQGASRLARHLWRMSFALFIAALSFFIGQARVFPKPIRIPGLRARPVLAVLVTMFYWLWRVRIRRSLRGIVSVRASEAV